MARETLVDFFADLARWPGEFLAYDDGFRSWSYSYAEVAAAARAFARRLEAAGYREIVLTGIHLAVWGRDLPGEPDLAELLDVLLAGTREVRYRLSSIEPMNFPRRLLDRMAERGDRVCPHLHLALQHASDAVLERMRRGYTRSEYEALAREFLDRVPGACLTTDVLVGFPGESEADFRVLVGFVRRLATRERPASAPDL